jgi:hypothetical protein
MAPNSYKPWNEEDVLLLENMYQYGASLDVIARALNRTPRAIEHGIKQMMIQQVMYFGVDAVAEKFHLTTEWLQKELAPPKYYPVEPVSEDVELEDVEPEEVSLCTPVTMIGTVFLAYFAVVLYGYICPLTL